MDTTVDQGPSCDPVLPIRRGIRTAQPGYSALGLPVFLAHHVNHGNRDASGTGPKKIGHT